MPVIGRAGSHLLAEKLCEDPFGGLYRGIELRDGRFHRHLLLRTFSEELKESGLAAEFPLARAALLKLGDLKAYGRCVLEEGDGSPYATSPYLGGRSLAEILARIRGGAPPMPMDSGLALVFGLAQEAAKLRGLGLHHGLLNPHSVWVGFDGELRLLDVPLAPAFQRLLPAAPSLRRALEPYQPPAWLDGIRGDLWQLGALAYELLALAPLPPAEDPRQPERRAAVERVIAGEGGALPVPRELGRMLHRMLGTEGGFASFLEFEREMERAIFDGEHVPTTFGLAFYMNDLFLKETRAEALAIPAEKEADFFVHTDAAAELKRRIQDNLSLLAEAPLPGAAPRRRRGLPAALGLGAALALGGGFLAVHLRGESEIRALRAQVAAAERRSAELDAAQSDLEQRRAEEARARARMEAQLAEARGAEAQAEIQRQLDETRKRQAALDRQQADLAAEQRRLAEARLHDERKPAPVPAPVPRPAPPSTLPAAAAPAAADAGPRLLAPVTGGLPAGFRGDGSPVRVRVFVSEQGRPQKAMVLGGDPALAELAKTAALAGTYAPAVHAGAPARDWVTVSVPFVQ